MQNDQHVDDGGRDDLFMNGTKTRGLLNGPWAKNAHKNYHNIVVVEEFAFEETLDR